MTGMKQKGLLPLETLLVQGVLQMIMKPTYLRMQSRKNFEICLEVQQLKALTLRVFSTMDFSIMRRATQAIIWPSPNAKKQIGTI